MYIFSFFVYKNYNIGAIVPAISMPVADLLAVGAFLSNLSLAIFVFLIARITTQEYQL